MAFAGRKTTMPGPGEALPGRAAPLTVATHHFVNGNPLDDITLLQNRENLALIMKDGHIFKNLFY